MWIWRGIFGSHLLNYSAIQMFLKMEVGPSPESPTRLPEFYDGTYEYLKGLGIKEI